MTLNMAHDGLEQPPGTTTRAAREIGDAIMKALPKAMPPATAIAILNWAISKKLAELAASEAAKPQHRDRIRSAPHFSPSLPPGGIRRSE